MKFLLDQGLARATAPLLNDAGHEAVHVGPLGMCRASDERIIAEAISRDAVIVTYDDDFHRMLYDASADRPSVIRIRIERINYQQAAVYILNAVEQAAEALDAGAVVSITERNIRVRALPLR